MLQIRTLEKKIKESFEKFSQQFPSLVERFFIKFLPCQLPSLKFLNHLAVHAFMPSSIIKIMNRSDPSPTSKRATAFVKKEIISEESSTMKIIRDKLERMKKAHK